jgi:hypothetical protein
MQIIYILKPGNFYNFSPFDIIKQKRNVFYILSYQLRLENSFLEIIGIGKRHVMQAFCRGIKIKSKEYPKLKNILIILSHNRA